MKNIKNFIIALCVALLWASTLMAQNVSSRTSKNISKIDKSKQEFKPVKYSKKNYALLKKVNGDISEYYVSELGDGTDSTKIEKKEKLFALHKNDHAEFVQFSGSGEQVVFRKVKNGNRVWKIHDIKSKEERIIESNEGSVNVASIYNSDKYLYITEPQNERNKVYLKKNYNNPVFIGNGISVLWAPDGNYFLLKSPLSNSLSLREKLEFGMITKDEYRDIRKVQGGTKREIFRRYMIYDSEGERLLILQDYDLVDWIQWSPDSKKIVLQERGDMGFKIVYLTDISENSLEIANVYHFQGFPKLKENIYTACTYPTWSPDGKSILFKTNQEDGHSVLYNNVYVLEDKSYQYFPIIESSNTFVLKAEWISEKSILIDSQNIMTKDNNTYVFTIE